MKPRILISSDNRKDAYINAVNNSGGIAIAQYCPEITTEYDGLLLCGGNDISPKFYNEEINGTVDIDEKRDHAESELIKAFAEKKKPIMGICRGYQLLNAVFGGSLYQDIPNHTSAADCVNVHKVISPKGNFIYDMYGAEFCVNSFHHQAIKEIAPGFEVVATTPDGKVIEAIMHKNLPIFGVQWHPERMCFQLKRTDTVDGSEIFKMFICLCK